MDPEFEVAHGLLALAYSAKGMHEEALGELRKIKSLEAEPLYLSYLVYVYGMARRTSEAETGLQRMRTLSKRHYVSPLWMAFAYAGLGDKGQAFVWLQRVFDERASGGTISIHLSLSS